MKRIPLLVLTPFLLVSCGGGAESSSPVASSQEASSTSISSTESSAPSSQPIEPGFKDKEIDVKYANGHEGKAKVRYYGNSEIPYMGLAEFYAALKESTNSMSVTKQEDGTYLAKNFLDSTATLDVKNQTLTSSTFSSFHITDLNATKDIPVVFWDGLPFTKLVRFETEKQERPFTLDFKKYDISIYGDDKDVYLPFHTLGDIFRNVDLTVTAFDGDYMYVYVENHMEEFTEEYHYMDHNPSEEFALYNYHEICLKYDLFSGRPGRSSLERYYDLSEGLDKALDQRPCGQYVKQMLKSRELSNYLVGLSLIGAMMGDGGHTGYSTSQAGRYVPSFYNESVSKAKEEIAKVKAKNYEEIVNYDSGFHHRSSVEAARRERMAIPMEEGTIRGEKSYYESGDTAYIVLRDFMGEIYLRDEWDAYYAGTTDEIPYGPDKGGVASSIVKGLEKAKANSSIKNVVIDLANNNGGSSDELIFLLGVLTGQTKLIVFDQRADRKLTFTYEIDANFDRVFDEKDKSMNLVSGLNLAVLTSRNGFSCGGISPVYLHDEGLFTLGESCGGGCCSILGSHDIYGHYLQNSSPEPMIDKKGRLIDEARNDVCDYPLPIPQKDNDYDYSSFYDVENISKIIKEHYSQN